MAASFMQPPGGGDDNKLTRAKVERKGWVGAGSPQRDPLPPPQLDRHEPNLLFSVTGPAPAGTFWYCGTLASPPGGRWNPAPLEWKGGGCVEAAITLIRLPLGGERLPVLTQPSPDPNRIEPVPPADGGRSWTPPSSPPTSAGHIRTTGPIPRSAGWWPGC